MNSSNFAHALLAVWMQFLIAIVVHLLGEPLFESMLVGAFLSIGFYFGREVAQHERKVGTPPWWSGFKINEWSKDAILDFVAPTIACAVLCLVTLVLS